MEFGQQASVQVMRLTELTYSQVSEPPTGSDPSPDETPPTGSAPLSDSASPSNDDPPPDEMSFSGETARPSGDALASYGPPQWARPSYTKGFAGADFALQLDGTLRCPAGHSLYAQERRQERNGSLRVLFAGRLASCRPCPLRERGP